MESRSRLALTVATASSHGKGGRSSSKAQAGSRILRKVRVSSVVSIAIPCIVLIAWAATEHKIYEPLFPFIIQVVVWGFGLIIAASREPDGRARVSDPSVIVLLWAFLYLLYPSVVWLTGGAIPFASDLDVSRGVALMWLHTLFLAAFLCAYHLFRGQALWPSRPTSNNQLPTGRLLFLLPLGLVLLQAAVRLSSTGTPFPSQTYGESWTSLTSHVLTAREAGGLTYLWVQFSHLFSFVPALVQGIGAGLLIVRARQTPSSRLRIALLAVLTLGLMLLLSGSSRASVLIALVVAVIFADMVGGRLRWSSLALPFVLALILFVFFGYYRVYSAEGFFQGAAHAYEAFQRGSQEGATNGPLAEFTGMLGKEATGLRVLSEAPSEGVMYIVRGVLAPFPGQFLPSSTTVVQSDSILTQAIAGPNAPLGYGVAGAALFDGYRLWGTFGVGVLAAIFGGVLGGIRRWAVRGFHGFKGFLLRSALAAGVFAWGFNIIRGDLPSLTTLLFYYLLVPWLFLPIFFTDRARKTWLNRQPPS